MFQLNTEILSQILEEIDFGIHIINDEGVTVYYNRACENIDNLTKQSVLNKPIKELVVQGKISKSIGLEVLQSQTEKEDIQYVNNNCVLARGVPLFEKGILRYVVIVLMNMSTFEIIENKVHTIEQLKKILLQNQFENNLKKDEVKDIIGHSDKIREMLRLARKASQVETTVLITGESGVGKGVFAKHIHYNSIRSEKPFVTINCAAIPKDLIESELFGYEKGAFTGAVKSGKKGLFEHAYGGTLFLDEIGDLPLKSQGTLLQAIQEKKIRPIGSNKEIEIDVRIIAATNKEIEKEVERKRFRNDLFYRLNIMRLEIPPLRERKEDIIELSYHFIDKLNKKYDYNKKFTKSAYYELLRYDWPGNIRELENMIERLIITSDSKFIYVEDVKRDILRTQSQPVDYNLKNLVSLYEKGLIDDAIKAYGSIKEAAKHLQIDESTLRKKISRLNKIFLSESGKYS